MESDNIYFFDSYAIIELIKGNERYKKYANARMLLTKLNLFEVAYWLLRETREKEAIIFLNNRSEYVIDFDTTTIAHAAYFRLKHKRKNVSMADCIGYTLSQQLGVPFLTGDKEFREFINVEFVV